MGRRYSSVMPGDSRKFEPVTHHDVPCRLLDVRTRSVGGRQYIARGPDVYELVGVAAVIWRLCNGRRSIEVIASAISDEYEVSHEGARGDVLEFVHELKARGFVEVVPPPSSH